jgi:two-component system nitrate/nitrite response regulator NarL
MAIEARVEPRPEPLRIRALVVSDVRLYREGMESALGRRDAIDVVGTASSISEAIERVAILDPAVIIVDVATRDSLPGIRMLAAAAPRSKIVAFAVDETASDIPSYAEAGVAGYVPCDASIEVLASTIESVTREEAPCSPRVGGALFRHITKLAAAAAPPGRAFGLSQRELEILGLIRAGLSNKDIARALTIEIATVKNHVHSLLQKLHVTSRGEASALGLTTAVRSRAGRI